MPLNLHSARQRAVSRRALRLLVAALLLALACWTLPTLPWGEPIEKVAETKASGAPPEAATRPNPPTVPIRGAVDEPESE